MITKIANIEQLKELFIETLLNKTDKISDVGSESVLNGIAFGCAKLAQKCLVNQSVVEAHLFPDTAYGEYLDNLARLRGVSPRFGASPSTAYVTIVANPGTLYDATTTSFTSSSGLSFSLETDVTVGEDGYSYAKVRCNSSGEISNVDPLTINKVNPQPSGHRHCYNEFKATGGRDNESDVLFRQRIKDDVNRLSRGTLSYLEQIFMKINPRVLRLHKGGIGSNGKMRLIVVSVNGQDFTKREFDDILSKSEEYLNLYDILSERNDYSLELVNPDWLPVDVDFRIGIDPSVEVEDVRVGIQIQMTKIFDYRFWKYGDKVEWEDLLFTCKNVKGVRYVPDNHFYPRRDMNVPKYRIPRIRSFVMRDLDGNVIESNSGEFSDVYFPNSPDEGFQNSVILSL